jgi:ribosomal protein S1
MSEQNEMHELLENFEFIKIFPGRQIKGTVILVERDKALVNFGYKSDGIITKDDYTMDDVEDLREILKVGDEIEAVVASNTNDDGNIVLSRKDFEEQHKWDAIVELMKTGETVTVKTTNSNESGVIAEFKGFSGFIPGSHLSKDRNASPADFVGKNLEVRIIEAKMKNNRNKLIFSRKVLEIEEAKLKEQEAWETLDLKEVYEGKVNRVVDFGAFVEVNGIEGLLHINEISWNRIKHPSDVLKEGDIISVKVLKKDLERKRVSLSLKATLRRPFELFTENYKAGDIVTGTVVSLTDFGAFVEIDKVQGLLHVSDISWDMVKHPQDVLKVGQEIEVKILAIDSKKERLSLGAKQLSEDPFVKYTKNLKRFDIVKGKVTSMTTEGVVVELADEIEGFVPTKLVSKDKLRTPAQILEKDQEVECKITDINRKSKTIKLTMIIENENEDKQDNRVENLSSYTLGDDNFTIGDLFTKK